jgi:hypothetical protein
LTVSKQKSSMSSETVIGKTDVGNLKMRLPKMSNDCDIIAFLMAWKKAAILNGISREQWSQLLPSALNTKALQVFA